MQNYTAREIDAISVNGAQLFNILPKDLTNMTNVELPVFKKVLAEKEKLGFEIKSYLSLSS